MTILGLLIIDIIIVIIYGVALVVMLITKASSDEIITATAIYCIAATIVNGIVYLYPQIWAVEGICHGYFINNLNNFSYSDNLYCCSMDKNDTYRKPNTGMLEQLYYQYKVESKDECTMIGDASGKPGDFSDSDKRCAENFGIDYIDVRDFLEL